MIKYFGALILHSDLFKDMNC